MTSEWKPARFQRDLSSLESDGVVLNHKIINVPTDSVQLGYTLQVGVPQDNGAFGARLLPIRDDPYRPEVALNCALSAHVLVDVCQCDLKGGFALVPPLHLLTYFGAVRSYHVLEVC